MVAVFQALKEFSDAHVAFNQEAFETGHKLSRSECRAQISNHYSRLELSFLDKQEGSKREPFDHDEAAAPSIMIEAPSIVTIIASEPVPTDLVATKLVPLFEPALDNPVTELEAFLANGTSPPSDAIPIAINPLKKVES